MYALSLYASINCHIINYPYYREKMIYEGFEIFCTKN